MTFLEMVEAELNRARSKHPTPIHNVMEGHSVILEEFEEFWEECRKQTKDRDYSAMLKELVQTAAMCARCAEDCGLVD